MLTRPNHINFSASAAEYFKNNLVIVSRSGETPPAVIINKRNPAITNSSINLFDENLLENSGSRNGGLFIDQLNDTKILGNAGMDYKVSTHITVADKLFLSHFKPLDMTLQTRHEKDDGLFYWNPDKLLLESDVVGDKEEYFVFAKSEFDIFKKLEEIAEPAIKVVLNYLGKKNTFLAADPVAEDDSPTYDNNYCIKQVLVDKYPEVAKYISQRKKADTVISQNFTKMTAVIDSMEKIVV